MDNTSLSHSYSDSCATADNKKTYSAQELGELMNTYPRKLLDLNIGFITRWFDCVFIEDVLRSVKYEDDILMLIDLIEKEWKYEVGERNEKVAKFDEQSQLWQPLNEHFIDSLHQIRDRVMIYRQNIKERQLIREKWKRMYSKSDEDAKLHLSDLPDDVRIILNINDDWLYSDFVELLQGPVKAWIDVHHLYDWSVVRFICRLRNIVDRGASLAAFGKFLKEVGLNNQYNNMKHRKDANNDNNFAKYEACRNDNETSKTWKLYLDGRQIEEILEPIIDNLFY